MTRRRARQRRRRVAALLLVVTLTGAVAFQQLAGGSGGSPAPGRAVSEKPLVLQIVIGGDRVESIDLSAARVGGTVDPRRLRALLVVRIPARWILRERGARVTYALARDQAARAVLASGGGAVRLAARPVSSSIRAPVVAQELRNNCESAALEILLATAGKRVPQLQIQRALPTSGPLDPVAAGPDRIWGDPELGFVGRADGGGTAGGFGVYEGPIITAAGRLGVPLEDLGGQEPRGIVQRVRSGEAVMVWVGLSDGPYGSWRSPTGRDVTVNFGEHAVVLTGVTADGRLQVINPLQGTREIWTPQQFSNGWRLLGRRAVAIAA